MRPLSFIGVCLTPVLLLLGAAGTPAAANGSLLIWDVEVQAAACRDRSH